MKPDGKDVLGFIALCGLAVAALSGAAFAQQSPTPVGDMEAKIGGAVSGRAAASNVSERERILLERIERLERRLNELELRFDVTAPAAGKTVAPITLPPPHWRARAVMLSIVGKAAEPIAPPPGLANAAAPNVAAAQPNAVFPMDSAASQQQPTQTTQAPALPSYAAWDKDGVKIIPYGTLIANVNYNSSALLPGSFAVFALPKLLPDQDQFNVSAGNTFLGVDIKLPKIGRWEINGKVDLNLRGASPLTDNNIFQPQFIHIYGEAKTERDRILAGQTDDVVAPLLPNSVNLYPIGFMPGNVGFFRPQVRFETYRPISDNYTFIFQGAVTQAINTLDVGAEDFGRQTSLPDGQARVALGYAKPAPDDPAQKRPFELGVSGHIGERRGVLPTIPIIERRFASWSGNIDLSFKIGNKLRFEAEYFRGSILGAYAVGIFQTFNPERDVGIRATGAWAQLIYRVNEKWEATGGYGRDDPYNRDLAFGQRSLNEMGFGNFFYKLTPRLWFALEFSGWKTKWVDLPTGRAFRIEPAVLFFF